MAAEAHVLCAQCVHFLYFRQCVRPVLILVHRPLCGNRGVVKLCEPLAKSLFVALAAYMVCVVEDTNSCVYGTLPFIGRHTDQRDSLGWRPEGRFCDARALKPRQRGPLPATALLVPMAVYEAEMY